MALSIKPYIENKERIHLIGIGGVSMNSLGELLLSRGVPISGSDRLRTDVTARLEALGAKITYEHKPENVEGASLIVRTAAVHDDNPEIVRAHELGIPVMERAEAWGHAELRKLAEIAHNLWWTWNKDYNFHLDDDAHDHGSADGPDRYGRQQPACHRRYAPYRRQGLFCG